MRTLLVFLFLSVAVQFAEAQNKHTVGGVVRENISTPIIGAGVILVNGKDTLKTVTDTAGKFIFKAVKSTKFSLKISSIGYEPSTKQYDLAESQQLSLEPITLKEESQMLQDVVIQGKIIPIRIKQDTVEYNALAYKTLPKDRVTELIKQLPGVQIDKDGNVKTMGKTLTKIRVNGKDFFTGDVKEFINKLPADLIAKVQMIDDYGEEANLTGIKTGDPVKILNLVTKDNKNSGIFGNAQLSLGTNKQYGLDGNANYWNGEKQMSFNGGLTAQDNGAGKSKTSLVGITFNNKLTKDLNVVTNYMYAGSSNDSKTLSAVETATASGAINNENNSTNSSTNKNQRLNLSIFKRNKKEFLTANVAGSLSQSNNSGISQSLQTITNNQLPQEITKQDLNNISSGKGSDPSLNAMVNYTRKLNKPGRSVSAMINASSRVTNSKDNLADEIIYYDKNTGAMVKDSVLNRLLDKKNRSNNINGSIKYAEPLAKPDTIKQKNIDLSYDFAVNSSTNRLSTFAGISGNTALVDSLSNAYATSFITNSLNLSYRYNSKRWRYSFGLVPKLSILNGKYENNSNGINRSVFNISPVANINYNISRKHTFDFNLSQNTTPPSFSQLQPVRETSNLQNIVIGNPDLKPSVRQSASLNYTHVDVKDGSMLQVGIMGNLVQNKVATNTVLLKDTLNSLRQETRYENTNGDYTLNGQYSYSKPLFNNKYSLEMMGTLGYTNNVFFSENVKGLNKSLNLTQGLTMRMNQKWMTMNAAANYSLNSNSYTIGYGNTGNAQTWTFSTDTRIMFGDWINAGIEVLKTVNTGFALTNSNPLLINMNLEKFLFSKRASIKISGFDLLAQGNNQQRSISGNVTTDTRTNQVTRYFLMSINMRLEQFGMGGS